MNESVNTNEFATLIEIKTRIMKRVMVLNNPFLIKVKLKLFKDSTEYGTEIELPIKACDEQLKVSSPENITVISDIVSTVIEEMSRVPKKMADLKIEIKVGSPDKCIYFYDWSRDQHKISYSCSYPIFMFNPNEGYTL